MVEWIAYIMLGAAIATPLLLLNIKFASRLGMIDWPKARGISDDQIPIVGHSLVFLSCAILLLLTNLYSLSPWFLAMGVVMAVVGYFDDRRPLAAFDKMFFQMVCVGAVVFLDPQIRDALSDKYGVWGKVCGFFFGMGLINAINFIDGIDGLAGVVIVTGAAGFMIFAGYQAESHPYMVYAAMLIGMMMPFLYLNVVRRKGFLGNVGSYFFSYVLAVLHLSVPLHVNNPVSRIALSALCFLIPVADSATVILSRVITLRSPFQADKGHLHHRLLQTSIALRYILLNFLLIEAGGLIVAVLLLRIPALENSWLPSFVCLSHVAISALLIFMIERASKRRLQAYFQRLDTGAPIYYLKYQLKMADGSLPSPRTLRRIEARISAEIRVSDLCYSEPPSTLFVTLSTLAEPLRGISSRLDNVFQREKIEANVVIDEGEYIKVSYPAKKKPKITRIRKA